MNENFYDAQNSISELALKQKFLSWTRNHLVASQFELGGECLTCKVIKQFSLPITMYEAAMGRHFYYLVWEER